MSVRRAVNEVFLHLRGRVSHAEACTERRCAASCDVAAFFASLEEPLPLDTQRRRERERLQALAKGEIPKAV